MSLINASINGFNIGANGSGVYLSPPVDGLFTPPVRTASGNYSGRDGGWVASQFFSSREIVVRGVIVGNSCDDAYEMRCALQSALQLRQSLPFVFTDSTGQAYYADVYFTNLNAGLEYSKIQQFEITLVAPDPYFYDAGDPSDPGQGWIEQTIEKIVGGGYITPYVLPVDWEPSGQPTIVNNPNDTLIYPQIILEGQFTNPAIVNQTTSQSISANLTTTVGDTLIFDLRERTITLNGGSVLPSMEGTWWPLVQGDNLIALTTDSSSDNDQGIIRYRIAYTGIGIGC